MSVVFNAGQSKARDQIDEFLAQSVDKYFYLFGYAGTGKTFIISRITNDLIRQNKIQHVYICAPTHKALNVLESYFKSNFSLDDEITLLPKMTFMTIHKLLEFKPVISNETGSKIFTSTKESKFLKNISNKLIIIDECSMISADMVKQINKHTELYPLKVIFMGDDAQLPPVSEPQSLIFGTVPKKYPYHVVLDEVMRTKSSDIKTVSRIVRQWKLTDKIETMINTLLPIHNKRIPNKTFRLYHKKNNYIDTSWFKKFVSVIESKKTPPIILTWTNSMSDSYNRIIRQHIHQTTDLDNYMPGDYVMFNNFYSTPDLNVFYTSDMIKIIQTKTEKKKLFDWNTLKLEKSKNKTEIAYNSLLRKLSNFESEFAVDTFVAERIHSDFIDPKLGPKKKTVCTINRADLVSYKSLLSDIQEHLEFFFKKYQSEKISSKLWTAFHKNLIDPFAELTFGYSTTIHKSQGSSFSFVFVDVEDVSKNHNQSEMQKALYTAITRASDELCFLI